MSEALFNRASKYFEQYLKEFQDSGIVRLLPRGRLNSSEWDLLNQELAKYGVCMTPADKDGKLYMKFSTTTRSSVEKAHRASSDYRDNNLGDKLKRYTGLDWEHKTSQTSALGYEHYRLRIDTLPQATVRHILDELDRHAIYDANAIYTNKGQFLVVIAPDMVLDSILEYYRTVMFRGVPAYIYVPNDMGKAMAESVAEKIMARGEHYAIALRKTGHTNGDCIVIAMKKSDAEKLGCQYSDGVLTLPRDNATDMARLSNMIGRPLTYINGVPAIIESKSDFGILLGRPVALVSVGGKKIPFYISSGTAGKTDVPAGSWEFFGGITDKDWFRKGTLEHVVNHYNSPALRQIANALDAQIGDTRDTIDVLKTIGREFLGGRGVVARMMRAPEISRESVNRDMFNPNNDGIFYLDLKDVTDYLQRLQPVNNIPDKLNQGTKRVKDTLFSRLASWFNVGHDNSEQ